MKTNKSKYFFREIAFLLISNFFPVQKLIFWPLLKLQKMEFGQKISREIDFFDFTSFFWPGFLKFFCLAVNQRDIFTSKIKQAEKKSARF